MMAALVVTLAGLYGLVIGSFLNVVAYRVPAGIPLVRESRCPNCSTPIPWWQNVPVLSWLALRGRCADCRAAISARYPVVEAMTGAAFMVVTWWTLRQAPHFGSVVAGTPSSLNDLRWSDPTFWMVLVAFLYFAAVSIVLTLIDLDTKRLPSVIVLPSIAVGVVLLTIAAAVGASTGSATGGISSASGGWGSLLRALAGAAILYSLYFLVRWISPRGMGGGDVRLAGLVGLYLGWSSWGALAVGAFAAFVLAGAFALVLMLLRRAGRKTAIPFGPWMIAGAWVGIALGEPIGRWYIGLFGVN